MTPKEAIKRLRQETAPATYNPDFDKEACLKAVESELERDGVVNELVRRLLSNRLTLVEKALPNGAVDRKIVDGFGCVIDYPSEETFRALQSLGVRVVRSR